MSDTSTADPIADAKDLAKAHRLFIIERHDYVYDKKRYERRYVTVWIVYRRLGEGVRPARLGKRRDPAALLRYVRTLI